MWVCGRTPVCTCGDACARRLTGQDTLTERPQSIFSPSSVVLPFFPFLSTFPLPFPFLAPDPSAPPCLSWVSLSNLILRSPYVLPLAYQGPEWLLCKYLDGAASAEEPREDVEWHWTSLPVSRKSQPQPCWGLRWDHFPSSIISSQAGEGVAEGWWAGARKEPMLGPHPFANLSASLSHLTASLLWACPASLQNLPSSPHSLSEFLCLSGSLSLSLCFSSFLLERSRTLAIAPKAVEMRGLHLMRRVVLP